VTEYDEAITANHESHERWHEDCAECQRILEEESAYHRGLYRPADEPDEHARVDELARDRADWILMEERG
jgi:hypothetical protein